MSEILLESGTNELEVLEFSINGVYFGINVSKVAEIITIQHITPIPNSHPYVRGILQPRDKLLTAVDLTKVLYDKPANPDKGFLVITNFNNLNMCFMVDEISKINRVSWKDITKPSDCLNDPSNGVLTGIIVDDDKLVSILDFEKIVTDISPSTGLQVKDLDTLNEKVVEKTKDSDLTVLIAEDSRVLNKMIVDCITKAGYKVVSTEDGQQAWDFLKGMSADKVSTIDCVVSDVEMPSMDGLTLARSIKSDGVLNHLPVIIFSSLVNEALERKVEKLGIDAMITKPEIGKLVSVIENLTINREVK